MRLTSATVPPSPWRVGTVAGIATVALNASAAVHARTAAALADAALGHTVGDRLAMDQAPQILQGTIDTQPPHTANKTIPVLHSRTCKINQYFTSYISHWPVSEGGDNLNYHTKWGHVLSIEAQCNALPAFSTSFPD